MLPANFAFASNFFCDLWVVLPEQFAGCGVYRAYDIHGAGKVQGPINDKWCGHEPDVSRQIQEPVDFEVGYIAGVNLIRGAESTFVVSSTIGEPVTCLRLISDGFIVVDCDFGFLCGFFPTCGDQQQTDVQRRSER